MRRQNNIERVLLTDSDDFLSETEFQTKFSEVEKFISMVLNHPVDTEIKKVVLKELDRYKHRLILLRCHSEELTLKAYQNSTPKGALS